MARTAGRDRDETRRLIVEAATRLIARRGSAVPVADIAREAGVSKGGLLYHFASKEDLLVAVATDLFERFRGDVLAEAQAEPEGAPGRLTRAYVRVSFSDGADEEGLRESIAVAAQLMHEPALQRAAEADGARWRADLLADGLEASVVRVVVAATDGVSSAPLWGPVLDADDRMALEAELVALTRG